MAKGTKKKKEPRVIPGTSDYVVRENAARKQLGVAGLAARNKQVPTAARAFTKEMTGIDISRKGVSVDPFGLAMALPLGKVLKAAKALRAAGKASQAAALESRVGAKLAGKSAGGDIAAAGGKSYLNSPMGKFSIVGAGVPTKTFEGAALRGASRNVFPRGTDLAKRALKAKSEVRTATRESLNYEFPFNRVINEAERIERKYGLTQRTAEEGIKQAKKAATAGAKYRAGLSGKSTRVAELEKRLNFPKKGGR
jgi:hypothetical protein